MPWQSPYRGEEEFPIGLPPRGKEIVSRVAMAVVGVILLYLGIRGIRVMAFLTTEAATQPAYAPRGRTILFPIFAWLFALLLTFLGGLTLLAVLLPVGWMQWVFERVNRPPVTGERGSPSRYGSWWDWWR